MNVKTQEKRAIKGYKVLPSIYSKAMRRAKKEKSPLANILENVVEAYAKGFEIKAVKVRAGGGDALDIFSENFSVRLNEIR